MENYVLNGERRALSLLPLRGGPPNLKRVCMTTNRAFMCLIPLLLSGCGSFVPTQDLGDLPPTELRAVQGVKIYDSTLLAGESYEIIDIVEGNSCQNKLWDPPATRASAIDQIKFYAYEMGADGISDVRCSGREGTSVRTNCWELISCTANAIRRK
jgi:hypothetical protein